MNNSQQKRVERFGSEHFYHFSRGDKQMFRTNYTMIMGAALLMVLMAPKSQAELSFSVDSWTQNSITLTVTGDMAGYTAPTDYLDRFVISYTGDLMDSNNGGLTNQSNPNTHSGSWFGGMSQNGNTQWYPSPSKPYAWMNYNANLASGSGVPSTMSWPSDGPTLNLSPTAGSEFKFWWGLGPNFDPDARSILLDTVAAQVVPEPSTGLLSLLGLTGCILARRRRRSARG